ncbi:RDD family protein [Streptomyces sp. NPDC048172]|uniref:RDD family protein n=1 Tax=Streptomyces sp. NPDC048172 TaxID=3365505 RepID=UPI003720A808
MIDPRGNQYAHHPPPQGPYGPYVPYRPYVPGRAGEARRYAAVFVDLVLAVTLGLLVANALGKDAGPDGTPMGGRATGAAVGTLIGFSFINQTLLTWACGASLGKLLARIRVVRATDGTRPGPFRLAWRWLAGLCWLPLQPYYWLRSWILLFTGGSAKGTVGDNEDGELYEDICGVRQVRRKDLRPYGEHGGHGGHGGYAPSR